MCLAGEGSISLEGEASARQVKKEATAVTWGYRVPCKARDPRTERV